MACILGTLVDVYRRRRTLLLALLLLSTSWLTLETFAVDERPLPQPAVQATVHTRYGGEPLLESYRSVENMARRGDLEGLQAFVGGAPQSFLRYRTLLLLARDVRVPMAERAAFYERALSAHLLEPLARNEVRAAHLEVARVAELAGWTQRALEAYGRAYPLPAARLGIARLEPRPQARAQLLLQLGAYTEARAVLERAPAHVNPLLEARVYRGVGELEAALAAYDRVLSGAPDHMEARTERAWVLLALGHLGDAAEAFSALPDATRERGLGAVAAARGELRRAAEHYRRYTQESGDPEGLWLATETLEMAGRPDAALPLYLELLERSSPYQVDAAYRALVLAERRGDAASVRRAAATLSHSTYFGVLRDGPPALPSSSALAPVTLEVLPLAEALERAGDVEAARGELLLALEAAREDEAATVVLAEALQALGEFRRSAQAADRWAQRGSPHRRTWDAAYPRAYPGAVHAYAAAWGVAPALVWAVMRQESAFYPRAVSTSQAKGLMQVVPATWTWLGELLEETPADPFNVADNIRYGTFYLSRLQNTFEGDLERTVAAYNGGPGYVADIVALDAVERDPEAFYRLIDRQETREYLQKVMLNYTVYQELLRTGEQIAGRQVGS